jgi:hypothetical protein
MNIQASCGIRTDDPGVWACEDNALDRTANVIVKFVMSIW